uniref:SCAN box domain-containing protein n=1 Tax=Felis catus TaxID=9685 RepID=A0ABI7VWF9_FELCA
MMTEESEVVLISAPQVQVPSESLYEDSVEDHETMSQRNPPNAAASWQTFRKFHYEDAAGPRDVLRHLQKLSGQWLRPDIQTKSRLWRCWYRSTSRLSCPRSSDLRPGDVSLGSEALPLGSCAAYM